MAEAACDVRPSGVGWWAAGGRKLRWRGCSVAPRVRIVTKGTPRLIAIVLAAVVAIVGMYFLHLGKGEPEPQAATARDVGGCVANGLLQKKSMSKETALDIGAKVKDATDANIGIKDKQTADVLQQVMSDDVQAQVVSGCVDEFTNQGAQPIFNPLVKVAEKVSAFPLGSASS